MIGKGFFISSFKKEPFFVLVPMKYCLLISVSVFCTAFPGLKVGWAWIRARVGGWVVGCSIRQMKVYF